MDSYNKKIKFHLPGLFFFWPGYAQLLDLVTMRPGVLKDNVEIGSIFDSPQCIWNGGRLIASGVWDQDKLIYVRDYMKNKNIPIRFTFTNCLLEEKHVYDTYGNMLLEVFNTGTNEIICNTEVLENYIRERYKNRYKYISSTTKRLNNKEEQTLELQKDYYLVVLDYEHNQDIEYLQSIPNKEKCELLCNPVCHPKCPKRVAHYKNISECQLNYTIDRMMHCMDAYAEFWKVKHHSPIFISIEDINNIYIPMGFGNFKLEGRTTHALDWIEIILYYLIKEDYKDEVRSLLQLPYR